MLTYKYIARDPKTGQKHKAEVEADSEQSASRLIRDQGLAPLSIKLKDDEGDGIFGRFANRIKIKDKIIFSRQLSTLINAGLPLVQSLRTVADQTESKPLQVVINKIIADVEAGSSLSASLQRHPSVFSQVYTNLVEAGEASGTLDAALERIAVQQEKDAEILAKVRGAMVYPLIVLLVMVGVVTFMIVSVLPQVKELYKGLPGAKLPFITRILLALSNFVIHFWWVVILLVIVAVIGFSQWARTPGGRSTVDRLKMRMPPFAQLFMKMYMARFARTGTTLVASGVPLLQMLSITANSINNVHVERSILNAIDKVKGGKTLSSCLENDPNFLRLVPDMLRIGEQSGAIEQMMGKTAEYFEKEVDNQIKSISTIIEPVLMVVMGIMALVIVAAILLPIYSLVGKNIIK